MSNKPASDFEAIATAPSPGLMREFWQFLGHNKKWWLLPLLLMLFVISAFLLLSGTAIAPFIYTLF